MNTHRQEKVKYTYKNVLLEHNKFRWHEMISVLIPKFIEDYGWIGTALKNGIIPDNRVEDLSITRKIDQLFAVESKGIKG